MEPALKCLFQDKWNKRRSVLVRVEGEQIMEINVVIIVFNDAVRTYYLLTSLLKLEFFFYCVVETRM